MSIAEYLASLRRTWWLVVGGLLLGLLAGGLVGLLTPPTYASTVQFYVSVGVDSTVSPQDAARFAQQRVASYVLLARSDELAAEVAEDLASTPGAAGLTPGAVAAMLDSTSEINTAIVTVTVSGGDRELGRAVATSLAERFPPLVDRLESAADGAVAIAVVGAPQTPATPVAPDRSLALLLGLAAGALLGGGAAVVRELFDTRVRGAAAVRGLLGAPVVAEVDELGSLARVRGTLVGVTEVLAVAGTTDRVLLVVVDGVSTAPQLVAARDQLAVLGIELAGAVLLRRRSAEGLDLAELTGREVGPGTVQSEDRDRGGRERPSELVDGGRG